jgi:hypothetical protein
VLLCRRYCTVFTNLMIIIIVGNTLMTLMTLMTLTTTLMHLTLFKNLHFHQTQQFTWYSINLHEIIFNQFETIFNQFKFISSHSSWKNKHSWFEKMFIELWLELKLVCSSIKFHSSSWKKNDYLSSYLKCAIHESCCSTL